MNNLAEQRIVRLRTIKAALEEIRELDSGTQLTEWGIRNLCKSNRIVFFTSGKKILVSMQSLLNYYCYREE